MFRPWYGDKMSKNNQKWTSVRSWDVCYKWTKMKVGAQCFDLDMVITWPKITKNKPRCEAEMRYKWTQMNFGAQCFKFDMVTKWPNIDLGAKLRCTKDEQKWTSYGILRIRCGDKRGNVRSRTRPCSFKNATMCSQDAAMCAKTRPCAPKNGCVRQGREHVRQRRGYVRQERGYVRQNAAMCVRPRPCAPRTQLCAFKNAAVCARI